MTNAMMSQSPQSPNNRNPLVGWIKNLKPKANPSSDSLNDVSDNELLSKPDLNFASPHRVSHDLLRPLLQHKARSTNSIRPASFGIDDRAIREQRDSFISSNQTYGENSKYFGVPLEVAVSEASAKITIPASEPDEVIQYGEIPVVVAKCGVFLKNKGLNVEGIFRVGGASKRVKELQLLFNSAPDYGKKFNWDGYNVHDAASVLRRYLNALPEPLVPLNLYEEFRLPLIKRARIISYMKYKADNPKNKNKDKTAESFPAPILRKKETETISENVDSPSIELPETPIKVLESPIPSVESSAREIRIDTNRLAPEAPDKRRKGKKYKKLTKEIRDAIDEYKILVNSLPKLSKQLLFYILDLLTMVQTHSEENLMSSRNLAAIFQPSILSHPDHDLDPSEYDLSQSVVDFLIQYAYKLLPSQTGNNVSQKADNPEDDFSESSNTDIAGTVVPVQVVMNGDDFIPPRLHPIRRKHSKSLSSTHNPPDMVGNTTRGIQQRLSILDSDNESNLVDFEFSEDDEQSLAAPHPVSLNDPFKHTIGSSPLSSSSVINKSENANDPLVPHQENVSIVISTTSAQ